MNLVKSPLNYVGGKYKLLPQILPLFPKDIDTFYDLFGGGANVAVNVNANKIVCNDINTKVMEILISLKKYNTDYLLAMIDEFIEHYELSKTNRDGFLKLRESYNSAKHKNPIKLYTLICYAFNYQIRFNNKGEYNMPFGKDRSSFNEVLRKKFIAFCDRLHSIDIRFTNCDFEDFREIEICENDFVYLDPPYYNSVACYNENGGWGEQDEIDLKCFLNWLTNLNIRWALSNNVSVNPELIDFANRYGYHIHYLSANYGNCNYHKKDKTEDKEVLITNYVTV